MILGYYDGLHFLDLLSSFQNTAWSALYGSWAHLQDDPLLGCLSHFKAECFAKGIQLEYAPTWTRGWDEWKTLWRLSEENRFPCLFVISGHSKEIPLHRILKRVETGSNLVVLYSSHLYSSYQDLCKELLDTLQLSESELKQYSKIQKIVQHSHGRILYINSDAEISDGVIERGPFGGQTEVEIVDARQRMDKVIDTISVFAIPYIDCLVRSVPASWPKDETLVVELEVRNKSILDIDSIFIDISLPHEFEPLSNNTIEVEKLKANSIRSIATLVVPRVKGVFTDFIRLAFHITT